MKRILNYLGLLLLIVCLTVLLKADMSFGAGPVYEVGDTESFANAVNSINTGTGTDYTIKLTADVDVVPMSKPMTIYKFNRAGTNITILGDGHELKKFTILK